MASKAMYETAQVVERTESITLEIEGLKQNGDGSFTLHGVQIVNIDYQAVEEVLKTAGVPDHIRIVQVELFAEKIGTAMIADAIAGRTKRIG